MKVKNKLTNEVFEAEREKILGENWIWISPLVFNPSLIVNSFLVSEKTFFQNYLEV